MFSPRTTSWLPIAGLLGLVAGALGWLLLGFGGMPDNVRPLREAIRGQIEFIEGAGTLDVAAIERLPPERWQTIKPDRHWLVLKKKQALWVRFTLVNSTDRAIDGVLTHVDFFVDRVDAWTRSGGDGGWRHGFSGEKLPVTARSLWGREIALPVHVPARGEAVIYVRGEDLFHTVLRLLWWPDQTEFTAVQARGLLAEGIYFGVLFALLGYNAMLWLRLRLADIGYYVFYLGAAALFIALARALPSLLGWTLATPASEALIAASMVVSGIFLTQFTRVFLDLKQRLPRLDVLARVMMGALAVIALTALSVIWGVPVGPMLISVVSMVIAHAVLLVVSIWAWRQGARQARFFVPSFGCLFAATIPIMGLWLGRDSFGSQPVGFVMIGSALEMLLLSLATADRFAQAQRDKTIAQEKLVEETEQRRAIQEAYADELAIEVRERTKDLEAANADKDRMIAVIGHDLRSPLTSLMQTAEQLALTPEDGAAFKKYAVDSAQVGRQTLLLIEDLVLWARLRAGLRSPPGRHAARALVAPVVALHRAFAGQRGVELAVDVPESLRLSTDLVLAQTLLRNLVANALKFARTRVEVIATEEAGGVRLTVRDDGPGLPAAVMAAFTKEFPEPADAESGLGLRLCVEISRALDTKLEVAPTPEGGTEFKLKLPL